MTLVILLLKMIGVSVLFSGIFSLIMAYLVRRDLCPRYSYWQAYRWMFTTECDQEMRRRDIQKKEQELQNMKGML